MLLLWTENLRVGVEEFDEDHKRLITVVNRLHGAIEAGTSGDMVGSVLGALEHYAADHCRREEMVLMMAGYPEAAAQIREHNELRRLVAAMKLRCDRGFDAGLSVDVMNLIYVWITDHIYRADRKAGEFLRATGQLDMLSGATPAPVASRLTPAQFLASDTPGANQEATAHSESIAPMIASESVMGSSIQRAVSILRATKPSSTPNP
jgi:hemerythrin-like metal-binding protein